MISLARLPLPSFDSVARFHRFREATAPLLAAALLAASLSAFRPVDAGAEEPFEFVVMGCMPYHFPDDAPRFENIIAAVNAAAPAFAVHCGDIKAGSTPCDDESFLRVKSWFDSFEPPLVYVPGDNEWTDCRRGFDPLERLEAVRRLFYPDAGRSLGRAPLAVAQQSEQPGFANYPEHQRWERGGVLFATLHVVGSNNNRFPDDAAAMAEHEERDLASIAWMVETFAEAKAEGRRAAALFLHANPFAESRSSQPRGDGFARFLKAMREEVMAFEGPVYLFHSDSHYFRIDMPLLSETGRLVENLTRIETFGSHNMHLVLVEVDPAASDPLRARPWLIDANRVDPAEPR